MARPIVVAPRVVMMVVGAFGNDLLKELVEILYEAGLKFDSRHSRSGTCNENCRLPFEQTRTRQRLLKNRRDVLNVAMAAALQLDLFRMDSHQPAYASYMR